jgi:hypothetical protein
LKGDDNGMLRTDGGMIDYDIVVRCAADGQALFPQLDFSLLAVLL